MTAIKPEQPIPPLFTPPPAAQQLAAPPLPMTEGDFSPIVREPGPPKPWVEPSGSHEVVSCKSCPARIFYAKILKKSDGKMSDLHPFDRTPIPGRKGYVMDDRGVMHHNAAAADDARVFESHFATCPNRAMHRKA